MKDLRVVFAMVVAAGCDRAVDPPQEAPVVASNPAGAFVSHGVAIANCGLDYAMQGDATARHTANEVVVYWSGEGGTARENPGSVQISVRLDPFAPEGDHAFGPGSRHRLRVTHTLGATTRQFEATGGSLVASSFDPSHTTMGIRRFNNVILNGGPGVECTMTGFLEVSSDE